MMTRAIVAITSILLVAGCGSQPDPESSTGDVDGETPASESRDQPVSILRPDVEQPTVEQTVIEPLRVVVGFPDGGSELDADAVGALELILGSEQLALGGAVVIEGHSDSGGSDRVNLDASQERALAVAAWLVAQGVDSDRLDVIVFGEQNPIEPNALPDGSANEAGRAVNRRVEVVIPTIESAGTPEESVETSN
jgi:OOP family OmpA-OmpF porin